MIKYRKIGKNLIKKNSFNVHFFTIFLNSKFKYSKEMELKNNLIIFRII